MKRSEFLKRLGLGIVAIPFAKQVAGAVTEIITEDDESRKMIRDGGWTNEDDVFPRYVDPLPKDFDGFTFSHYEEPWIHVVNPWPLQINDVIMMDTEKTYLVTQVFYGQAKLTAIDSQDEDIFIYRVGENLRFYGGGAAQESQYIALRNFKSEL